MCGGILGSRDPRGPIKDASRRPTRSRKQKYRVGLTSYESTMVKHVFVIGPGRTGTHFLWKALCQHPNITCAEKELNFFLRTGSFRGTRDKYMSHFNTKKFDITLDATPYFGYYPIPERLSQSLDKSDIFIIGGIKDPLKRYMSGFFGQHLHRKALAHGFSSDFILERNIMIEISYLKMCSARGGLANTKKDRVKIADCLKRLQGQIINPSASSLIAHVLGYKPRKTNIPMNDCDAKLLPGLYYDGIMRFLNSGFSDKQMIFVPSHELKAYPDRVLRTTMNKISNFFFGYPWLRTASIQIPSVKLASKRPSASMLSEGGEYSLHMFLKNQEEKLTELMRSRNLLPHADSMLSLRKEMMNTIE